jgi:hypothetical protein
MIVLAEASGNIEQRRQIVFPGLEHDELDLDQTGSPRIPMSRISAKVIFCGWSGIGYHRADRRGLKPGI